MRRQSKCRSFSLVITNLTLLLITICVCFTITASIKVEQVRNNNDSSNNKRNENNLVEKHSVRSGIEEGGRHAWAGPTTRNSGTGRATRKRIRIRREEENKTKTKTIRRIREKTSESVEPSEDGNYFIRTLSEPSNDETSPMSHFAGHSISSPFPLLTESVEESNQQAFVLSNLNSLNGAQQASIQHNYRALETSQYETKYACEGQRLDLACSEGKYIQILRAIYGRFSLNTCNENGHYNLSVQCANFGAHRITEARCKQRQSCNVTVSTELFGSDPCEGTPKYLEVQYHCDGSNNNNNSNSNNQLKSQHSSPLAAPTKSESSSHKSLSSSSSSYRASSEQKQIATATTTTSIGMCAPQKSLRNIEWNSTRLGESAKRDCPDGSSGEASWFCSQISLRFEPSNGMADFSNCKTNWLTRLIDEQFESSSLNLNDISSTLRDLSLLVKTKSLFSNDLNRISLFIGQIRAQISMIMMNPNYLNQQKQQQQQQVSLAQFEEQTFNRIVEIISSLYDSNQRLAWLELPSDDIRDLIDGRLLAQLRESALQLLSSSSLPLLIDNNNNNYNYNLITNRKNWKVANFNLALTVIDANTRFEHLDLGHLRIQAPLLAELTSIGLTKILSIEWNKQEFSLSHYASEQQQQQQLNEQTKLSKLFGAFAVVGANNINSNNNNNGDGNTRLSMENRIEFDGQALNSKSTSNLNSQRNEIIFKKINDFAVHFPIDYHFDLSDESSTTTRNNLLLHCNSQLEPQSQNRCKTSSLNITSHVCRCDQFGFVASTSEQPKWPTNSLPSSSLNQNQPQPQPQFPYELGAPSTFIDRNRQQVLTSSNNPFENILEQANKPFQAIGSEQQQQQQDIGSSWSKALLYSGFTLLLVSIFGLLLSALFKLTQHSRLNQKQAQTFLGFVPNLAPPSADHNLASGASCCASSTTQSTSIINLNQAATYHLNQQQQHQHQSATATPMYAAHLPPLKASEYVAANRRFGDYCGSTPSWISWLRPSRLFDAISGRRKQLAHVHHHRVIGATNQVSVPYSAKSHFQNGYTTSLHQSGGPGQLVGSLSAPTSSNSTSSYVSSSAYYEEIGPGNLTKLSTSQLVPLNQPTNSQLTTTIIDPLMKRNSDQLQQQHQHQQHDHQHIHNHSPHQRQSYGQMEPQQTMNPSYGQSMPIVSFKQQQQQQQNPFGQLDLISHGQHFQSSSSSAGSQHSAVIAPQSPVSSSSAANSTSTPRHYLFASPSAVNAYKTTMSHQTMHHHHPHHHSHLNHGHNNNNTNQNQFQQQQQQQRFMHQDN